MYFCTRYAAFSVEMVFSLSGLRVCMRQSVQHLFMMSVAKGQRLDAFVALLREKGVDCVVDVRAHHQNGNEFDGNVLAADLKREGFIYMSFHEEFGSAEQALRMRNGDVDYARVCVDAGFVRGIERLQKGMQRGFVILLLGAAANMLEDFSYRAIGRRLTEMGYQVWHILGNGRDYLQKALEEEESLRRQIQRNRAEQAANLGRMGEDIAAEYLEKQGFAILDRNWNLHRGCEIDIVARRGDVVHFVEVKTRNLSEGVMAGVTPESAINWKKMRHIYRAAKAYKSGHGLWSVPSQVDSISIVVRSPDDYDLHFFEDIRYMEKRFY